MNILFPDEFYEYLQNHTLIGIKGGLERPGFLEIWMVTINGRVFARTWEKSKRSWFTAFEETGVGQIQCGETIFLVKGKKLVNDPKMNGLIHEAYRQRYNKPHDLFYSNGITQPEYEDFTMEFFYMETLTP